LFNILLNKGAEYDPDELAKTMLWWSTLHLFFMEALVSRPVLFSESLRRDLLPSTTGSAEPRERLKLLLLKHIELMKSTKQPMFKLKPSFPLQALPPLVETDLLTQLGAKNEFKFLEALKRGDSPDSVTVPIENNPATSALHLALKSDSDEFATALIDAQAHVNWCDSDGATPLLIAVAKGNLNLISKLLAKKVDVNGEHAKTFSRPLDAAQNLAVVKLLLAHGAAINYRLMYGSAMSIWVARKNREVIFYLLEHGGDLNFTNHQGLTPLYSLLSAQSFSHKKDQDVPLEFIQFLKNHGASIKIQDSQKIHVVRLGGENLSS